MKLLYFFIFCFITAASSKICLRKDYLVHQCLKAEIENIKPHLNHEMIRLDRLQADTSINGVKMKAVFYNIAAFRLSTFKVDDLRVNLNDKSNLYAELHVTVPEMLISADYDFRGMKMFFFGFHTYGKFYGKFNNIKLVFRLNISTFLQRGDEYLRLTYVTAGIQFNHAEMHLQPRDRTYTGRKIAYYAQSDPHSALVKLTPAIEYNVARLFQKHVNDVLAKLPSKYIIKD